MMEYKYTNSIHESLAAAWMTYNQDAETYAPLVHKSQGFEEISIMLQLD